MADRTDIAWTDSTFNCWIGCTKVGPGCDNCYAEREFDHRHHRAKWGAGQERSRTSPANWKKPLQWNAKPFYECPGCGWRGDKPEKGFPGSILEGLASCPNCDMLGVVNARRRVFCASLADVFDNEVPVAWRADLFDLIAKTPNLVWLLLTKRIGNAKTMLADALSTCQAANRDGMIWPLPNVWIGATICNQTEADRDIPKLLAVPAAVRFVSMEPLLGPVRLNLATPCDKQCDEFQNAECPGAHGLCAMQNALDWVITGFESGPSARPGHPQWVRELRDQCKAAGVPLLHKQNGEWAPATITAGGDLGGELRTGTVQHLHAEGNPEGFFRSGDAYVRRVGKKAAGRLIDGKLHNEFPEPHHDGRSSQCGVLRGDSVAVAL